MKTRRYVSLVVLTLLSLHLRCSTLCDASSSTRDNVMLWMPSYKGTLAGFLMYVCDVLYSTRYQQGKHIGEFGDCWGFPPGIFNIKFTSFLFQIHELNNFTIIFPYCYIVLYSYASSCDVFWQYNIHLQHSCQPNLFVQNIFVDTHDLRFPWVAFFTNQSVLACAYKMSNYFTLIIRNVKALTELTWDYNYEVGSVPDKELPCYCGATNCRKRLL